MDVLSVERSNLEWLNLSDNQISETGASFVAQMLETNDTLTHLWLETNRIDDPGVKAIAVALKRSNRTLERLFLNGNEEITNRIVAVLIWMLDDNQTLTQLELIDCGLSEHGQRELNSIEKGENFCLKAYCSLND